VDFAALTDSKASPPFRNQISHESLIDEIHAPRALDSIQTGSRWSPIKRSTPVAKKTLAAVEHAEKNLRANSRGQSGHANLAEIEQAFVGRYRGGSSNPGTPFYGSRI